MRMVSLISKNSALKCALFFFVVVTLESCNSATRELFFDIPPPKPQSEETEEIMENADTSQTSTSEAQATAWTSPWEDLDALNSASEPPPIEDTLDWQVALELLPKDYKKKADWSAALEQGVIRPRGGANPMAQLAVMFQYDFIIPAEKPKNEAYFPHSAHTQWLGCKNCHMAIFPYKRNPATMKEMRNGASCGTCHGKNNVAFSLTSCKRCHLKR